jgi:hypothetical protein
MPPVFHPGLAVGVFYFLALRRVVGLGSIRVKIWCAERIPRALA